MMKLILWSAMWFVLGFLVAANLWELRVQRQLRELAERLGR